MNDVSSSEQDLPTPFSPSSAAAIVNRATAAAFQYAPTPQPAPAPRPVMSPGTPHPPYGGPAYVSGAPQPPHATYGVSQNPAHTPYNPQSNNYSSPVTPLDPHLQNLDSSAYGSSPAIQGHGGRPNNDVPATPTQNGAPGQSSPAHPSQGGFMPFDLMPGSMPRPEPQEQEASETRSGYLDGMYRVPNPPHLERWRQALFDVDGTFMLTEDQFKTYFPHVDNVYSHRSTQKYKRKPFISHYWDCRLKGRPPGTPKSDDPNKKKRKRLARERDLCNVKIKITEYFPGARATMRQTGERPNDGLRETAIVFSNEGIPSPAPDRGDGYYRLPGMDGERFYTICRVSGGSDADGVPGRHLHALADSDRIKKSSIQRELLKQEKDRKQTQKTYHKKATGPALLTVKRHSKEQDLKLYGSCFCPFVQRVWIALEAKGIPYQYIEVDPYKKPASLLALNPLGLVPALQHGDFSCHESSVLLEYIEESFTLPKHASLHGTTPQSRATARLWVDHIAKKIIPPFYKCLQAQETSRQTSAAKELQHGIETLVKAADAEGPFFAGQEIGYVDVFLAPWMLRLRRVLSPYRGWPEPEPGSRWARWIEAVENEEAVKATISTDELYLDSYERYAENRPNTSQLAEAINSGGHIP